MVIIQFNILFQLILSVFVILFIIWFVFNLGIFISNIIEKICGNLSIQNTIEIFFGAIYFLEQIALVLLYHIYTTNRDIWIAIFPAVFLTTIDMEKILIKADYSHEISKLGNKLDISESVHEKENRLDRLRRRAKK